MRLKLNMILIHTNCNQVPFIQCQDELEASIATLQSLAVACDADCRVLRRRVTEGDKEVAQFLIRKRMDDSDFMEVRP